MSPASASPCWPRLLNVHLAASYLSVGPQTIRDWVAEGLITPVPMPGSTLRDNHGKKISAAGRRKISKILIDRADIDAFIEQRKGAA
jgi:predicted site-specific integrase-resolvase